MVKIIKRFQGQAPENKILNYVSDSETDGYSCAIINGMSIPIDAIIDYDGDTVPEGYEQVPDGDNKDLVKLALNGAFEVSATDYKHLPFGRKIAELNEFDSFSVSSDGYVTINNDKIKKVRVYASVRLDDWGSAGQYLSIFLNGTCEKRVCVNLQSSQVETEILVKKGDVIDVRLYCGATKALSWEDIQYTQLVVSVA